MNNDGDFEQAKTISKDTWDATTSRAFENYAIAAGTALLTTGLMDVTGLNEVENAAQASQIQLTQPQTLQHLLQHIIICKLAKL